MHRVDTAAASDIHLGSKRSHVRHLHREWEELYLRTPPRQFLVVGDFFDDIDDITDDAGRFSEKGFLKLPDRHRAFVEFLAFVHHAGISQVVVLEGNHDCNKRKRLINLRSSLLPGAPKERHRWGLAGQTWLATHGHTLDPEWLHRRWVPEVANKVFRKVIQRFDKDDASFSRWVEQRVTTGRRKFLRKLLPSALAGLAFAEGADHVIGGHSHQAVRDEKFRFGNKVVHSHNCGCWVSDECTWLDINAAGGLQLRTVEP